jgi:hypothetical protein
MHYDFTSIEYSNWPEEPMFIEGDEFIKTTIHLTKPVVGRIIDVELSVGDVLEGDGQTV